MGVAKGYWTRERIVEAVHEWATRFGEPPTANAWNPAAYRFAKDERYAAYHSGTYPCLSTVRDRFGRWSDMLREAGFMPHLPKGRRAQFSREEIINALHTWADHHGAAPRFRQWQRHTPSTQQAITAFGSWNAALQAAGLPTRRPGRQPTTERELNG